MLLKFEEIKGRNIGPFDEFELPILPGRHLVIGKNNSSSSSNSNGSGKSFLTEPLLYAPYKKSFRGKDISKDSKGSMLASISFQTEDHSYVINRYYNDKKEGSEVILHCDLEDISDRISSLTDKKILNTFGISSDLFSSTILISQGLPINFSQMTPTIRKAVFEEILGFTIWDNIRNKFNSFSVEISNQILEIEEIYNGKKDKMISLNSKLETMKENQDKSQDDFSEKIILIKNEIKDTQSELLSVAESIDKNFSDTDINNLADQINELSSSLSWIRSKIADLKTIIDDRVCPTCNQDFPEVMISNAEKEYGMLSKKINSINSLIQSLNLRKNSLNELISEKRNYEMKVRSKNELLINIADSMNKSDNTDEIEKLSNQLKIIHGEVTSLYEELGMLKNDINHSKFIEDLLKPSSQFRSSLLESYLSHVNNIVEEIIPLIFEGIDINLSINSRKTGIEIELLKDKKKANYKSLSGGEKRRVDIILIIAIQRFLFESSGINTNLIIFDEIFDGLDKTGIDLVLSCIDSIFPDYMSVIVISHNDYFKASFDSIIIVEKDQGGNSSLDLTNYRSTEIAL